MTLKRTSISIDAALYQAAVKRYKTLVPPYRSFSEYLAFLISKDCLERRRHTIVREEDPNYNP